MSLKDLSRSFDHIEAFASLYSDFLPPAELVLRWTLRPTALVLPVSRHVTPDKPERAEGPRSSLHIPLAYGRPACADRQH
jgi:hypothetical protein